MVLVPVDGPREVIPWVASMVRRHHQQDVIVVDTLLLQVLVEDECVERVSVVKVELRGGEDDVEVVFVALNVLLS